MSPQLSPVTVHVVERMAPGGIETLVLDMVRETPGRHVIVSLQGTTDSLIANWPALEPHRAGLTGFDRGDGFDARLIAKLRKYFRSIGATTVIAHHIGPLVYAGLAARAAGIRTVIHVEHDAWHYQSLRRQRVAKALFAIVRPQRVAVSREIAERIAIWDRAARITVIPPGIDMNRFRQRDRASARRTLGISSDRIVIGTAGRLVEVKGQKFLIEALSEINAARRARSQAPALAVIAGDGPERHALEELAMARGVQDDLMLLGHRDNLPDILPAFDVFCLPSLNEGLPRSILEAQAAGLPVVATEVGDLKSAVCPKTGRLVPAGDSHALAEALLDLLARGREAATPRAFVEDRFSLTSTLAAYQRLLAAPSSP